MKRKYILAFIILFVFWLIIIPALTLQEIIAGLFIAGIVVWLNKDILFDEDLPIYHLKMLLIFLNYIFIIIVEIVKASIDVAKTVLSKDMKIQPGFYRVPLKLESDFVKTFYGISINLTPGTLTVEANEEDFLIHALTEDAGSSLYEPNVMIENSEKLDA